MKKGFSELVLAFIVAFCVNAVVSASEYGSSYVAKWKKNASGALSLTFDDSGESINRNASAMILEQYGVRGTFHLDTERMDTATYLDIFNRGHELSSHTVTHPHLPKKMSTIIYELSESRQFLENLTGVPCVSFAYPYGEINEDIISVAQQYYICARGIHGGMNGLPGTDIYVLGLGPVPSYFYDPDRSWTDEEYVSNMLQHVEELIAGNGWGIQMFHELVLGPSTELNSGEFINENTLRTYLSEITADYPSQLWITHQGLAARYYTERLETVINTISVTDTAILLDLVFDGDTVIFNQPLSVMTVIPEGWLFGNLAIAQNGVQLNYTIDTVIVEYTDTMIVSGDISPDATDTYARQPSDYNGQPCYKAVSKEFYIWSTGTQYYLSYAPGYYNTDCWYSTAEGSPTGIYRVDEPDAVGSPLVAAMPRPPKLCALYDAQPGGGLVSIVFEPLNLRLSGVSGNVCHLTWSSARNYKLEYAATPDFNPILSSIDVTDTMTEYYLNTGDSAVRAYFRMVMP